MLIIRNRTLGSFLWQVSLLLFLSIAFNSDWQSNSMLWWSSIGLLALSYAYKHHWKIVLRFNWYDTWWIIFTAIALLSSTYAVRPSTVFDSVKTFLVMFAATYLIGRDIKSDKECEETLYILLLALFVACAYVFLFLDLEAFVLTRIGAADTGRWNANTVGIMTAFGILIALYFLKVRKSVLNRLLMLLAVGLFAYLLVITASRKAVLMLVIGFCANLLLQDPKRIVRNALLIPMILCLSYWAVMEIPMLYELIGWRIDGMIAAATGGTSRADSSSLLRLAYISFAVDCFFENPILGCGMDNFRFFNPIQQTYSHNNFTEIAADLGIVGLIAYYWIFIAIIIDHFRKKRRDRLNTLLFVFIMLYLMVHYAMVTASSTLQNIFICLYIISSEYTQDAGSRTSKGPKRLSIGKKSSMNVGGMGNGSDLVRAAVPQTPAGLAAGQAVSPARVSGQDGEKARPEGPSDLQ